MYILCQACAIHDLTEFALDAQGHCLCPFTDKEIEA